MLKSKKILFQMAGSIACYKACAAISHLVQDGHEVQVVASKSALNFIGTSTLEGLTGKKVVCDLFEQGHALDHIQLSRWCDMALLCPATANTINKLSYGFADDLIGNLFLAHDKNKPYIIFPAMNSNMYLHPSTQSSLSKLQHWGIHIAKTNSGILACGENGPGKLLEPEEIIKIVHQYIYKKTGRNILITAGGTQEPLDGVRFITNTSSGETASTLADIFIQQGHQVSFIHAQNSQQPQNECKKIPFTDFKSLADLLAKDLEHNEYDLIIHAAAVSDYSIDSVSLDGLPISFSAGKISSNNNELNIKMKKNLKLLPHLKNYSRNKNVVVVGFKLTNTLNKKEQIESVQNLFASPNIDYVVHNDLHEISDNLHNFTIYDSHKEITSGNSKTDLAYGLLNIFDSPKKHPHYKMEVSSL